MADKEMTLMMQIKARADQFHTEFAKAEKTFKDLQDRAAFFGKTSSTAFGLVGKGVSLFVSPMKMALQAGTALAGSLLAVGTASIYAAAEDERLIGRLKAVYGSAEKAEQVFGALEIQSVKSGKSTEDMADALIILQQYGLSSSKSLFAITNAAKVAGTSVEEMSMSVAALQTRGLKKFGIELDDKGGQYTIKARDASGKMREVIVKDAEAARKKLIDIFAFKFGTNMQASGFLGMLSGLKNGLGVMAGSFGDSMKDSMKPLLEYLQKGMVDLLESGKIEDLGKKAAEWLTGAVDNLLAAMDTLPKVWQNLKNIWEKGGESIKNVLLGAFTLGAGIFSDIFVGVLAASAAIWAGIGEILASVFMKEILLLPGMENLRQRKIGE
ncbi:MAG: hypothetical protein LLF89_09190, partial [Spirochaetaceae bacterium]|nr:hypothetical protein [Spirochaetaceae bacterium]